MFIVGVCPAGGQHEVKRSSVTVTPTGRPGNCHEGKCHKCSARVDVTTEALAMQAQQLKQAVQRAWQAQKGQRGDAPTAVACPARRYSVHG